MNPGEPCSTIDNIMALATAYADERVLAVRGRSTEEDVVAADQALRNAVEQSLKDVALSERVPEQLKPGHYVIRYNDDGEFGQRTGWLWRDGGHPCAVTGKPVYVWRPLSDLLAAVPQPPQEPAEWVGLTDEDRGEVYAAWRFNGSNASNLELCRAIEAKLREKNGGWK